jgi:hypothetical protein
MSQNDRILSHLKRRPMTSLEAFTKYGISRLASRVLELKQRGYKVHGYMVSVKNRFGETCRVKRYYLAR